MQFGSEVSSWILDFQPSSITIIKRPHSLDEQSDDPLREMKNAEVYQMTCSGIVNLGMVCFKCATGIMWHRDTIINDLFDHRKR